MLVSVPRTVPQNINETILLQYSTNGGITWTTILTIAHNDNSGETRMVTIPDGAKTSTQDTDGGNVTTLVWIRHNGP